jgi:hypothetical protein
MKLDDRHMPLCFLALEIAPQSKHLNDFQLIEEVG